MSTTTTSRPVNKVRDYYAEEVAFLRSLGRSATEILEQLDASPVALARALHREGCHDLARPFDRIVRAGRTGTCPVCGCVTSEPGRRCGPDGQRARLVTVRGGGR